MKLKIFLTLAAFFVATPILIGQTLPDIAIPDSLPSTSGLPTSLPGNPLGSSLPQAPSLSNPLSSTPQLPSSLSADSLRQSGLDTSILGQDPRTRAASLRDQYRQGLLSDTRLPQLPSTDQLGNIAKEFAEQTFPQEFQASKGLLNLPEAAPAAFSSAVPASIPSSIPTSIPSSIPSIIPTVTPQLPTLPHP